MYILLPSFIIINFQKPKHSHTKSVF